MTKTGKLIPREEVARWRASQDVLHRAREEADRILAQAAERAREIEHQARNEASAERSRVLLETVAERDRYLAGSEADLVQVVVNAVRSIFARFSDREGAEIAVHKALKSLRNPAQATLRVHPSHYEHFVSISDRLARECPPMQLLTVEQDARLKPGVCVLTCGAGVVETDLEGQIRAIENALLRKMKAEH